MRRVASFFFCGAGISYPAGLPGFKELTEKLYESLGGFRDQIERTAFYEKRYDTAIYLLEKDDIGGRAEVRKQLSQILTPEDVSPGVTRTHKALLTLSKCHNDGNIRIVTTNFDRLFEVVIDRDCLEIDRYQAPLLPIPKKRWDGLVYLHGLLSESLDERNLDSLVVSSGDFGLAYLTERWAARFVGELFRCYHVCFVGYSLDDPVLRYMADAMAADKQRGESQLEMYAFGGLSQS